MPARLESTKYKCYQSITEKPMRSLAHYPCKLVPFSFRVIHDAFDTLGWGVWLRKTQQLKTKVQAEDMVADAIALEDDSDAGSMEEV